jgi:hypothetical protein
MKTLATLFLSVVMLGAFSHTGRGAPGPTGVGTATTAATREAAAPPRRDVSTLKACEIVSPREVAALVGGTLLNEPPAGFPNCTYVVEVTGDTESYRLNFADPHVYTAMLDTQSEAEKGERLSGLWDEAYVQPRAIGRGFTVIAVRRGDIAMEVSGDRKEPAVAIATLAVSRVR